MKDFLNEWSFHNDTEGVCVLSLELNGMDWNAIVIVYWINS